jgi:ubiquinone/menaquinone biosynthesis C-methylase UbiE
LTDLADSMLRALEPDWSGRRVLDLACGDGRWSRIAVKEGAGQVFGLDFVAEMIAAAARSCGEGHFVAGDLHRLPFTSRSVDLVVLSLALSHVPQPDRVLAEIVRVLDDEGRLLLVDLHPNFAGSGMQRSFKDAQGRTQTIAWYPHAPDEIAGFSKQRGLLVETIEARGLPVEALAPDAPKALADLSLVYALSAFKA